MFRRLLNLPTNRSFFLFGARGTGKTSLLHSIYNEKTFYIDLLNLDVEAKYQLDPEQLYRELKSLGPEILTVVIDEVQKAPKLLDVVHRLIEERKFKFILTGSSARKLKKGAANLLAGRAVVFNLFPLLAEEIKDAVDLQQLLEFGSLPAVVTAESDLDRRRILKAYSQTYLKEEVWGEQLIRKIEPFRKFLPVAAQMHGQRVNFRKIARQVGVDDTTIKTYYSILEDTLLGVFLEAYSGSVRKQLLTSPKFYLFDNGVKRALEDQIDFPMKHGSFDYGLAFETFIIFEIQRRIAYREISLGFSFLSTEGGAEIDLLISRGNKVLALVEIKSGRKIDLHDLRHLVSLKDSFKRSSSYCLYQGEESSIYENINILNWEIGIERIVNEVTAQ